MPGKHICCLRICYPIQKGSQLYHYQDSEKKVVQYSAPLMIPELGIVFRLSAHPSCNRSMDPIPIVFWKHAIMKDWIKAGAKIPSLNLSLQEHRTRVQQTFVGATVLQTMG
jgi:hypothetical protein